MCGKENCCEGHQRVTSIQIGAGQEVMIEDLLMKLAMVQDIIRLQGMSEEDEPLSEWTGAAILQNLGDVSHALKCACWGYQASILH